MSIKNGVWHDAKLDLPKNHEQVLVVKQLKNRERSISIGYCIPEYTRHDYVTGQDVTEPYWVCSGNNNIIYWMPLPKMPKEEKHET